jgi:hypothetical protein
MAKAGSWGTSASHRDLPCSAYSQHKNLPISTFLGLFCTTKEDAWRAIYHLHREWRNYRLKNNLQVWQEEYDLSRTPAYVYEEQNFS